MRFYGLFLDKTNPKQNKYGILYRKKKKKFVENKRVLEYENLHILYVIICIKDMSIYTTYKESNNGKC